MVVPDDRLCLEDILDRLPADRRREVEDFARFLLSAEQESGSQEFDFAWAGSLRNLGEEYTSSQLQEKSLDWWES